MSICLCLNKTLLLSRSPLRHYCYSSDQPTMEIAHTLEAVSVILLLKIYHIIYLWIYNEYILYIQVNITFTFDTLEHYH